MQLWSSDTGCSAISGWRITAPICTRLRCNGLSPLPSAHPKTILVVEDNKLKYKDMVDKGSLKPELLRYELHRVWEVEATLKPGMAHIYAKRSLFIDEDSHLIALTDAYDSRGNLISTTYPSSITLPALSHTMSASNCSPDAEVLSASIWMPLGFTNR